MRVLGKKELTQLLRRMARSRRQRKVVGEKVNLLKAEVEGAFVEKLGALERAAREADLNAAPYDITLPGRVPAPRGHLHPLTQVKNDVLAAFRDLGFVIGHGPEVELEENNFTKLGFPPDHPATDMQDTFWIRPGLLLRTHTSNVQVREMLAHKPPLAVVSAGAVYRKDEDVTHSPMFHQVEGFLVDEHVTFAELKGVLNSFAERIYGPKTPVRFRPSYSLRRARRRGRRRLRVLQKGGRDAPRLPHLQVHRVDRDPRMRHDPPRRIRAHRYRPRALLGLCFRNGHRARRDAALRRPRRASVLRERSAALGPVLIVWARSDGDDTVRPAHRVLLVSDEDDGPRRTKPLQRDEHALLRRRVETGGGLIEQKDRQARRHGPRECEPFALPSRDGSPGRAELDADALVREPPRSDRTKDLRHGARIGGRKEHVFFERPGKQRRLLGGPGERPGLRSDARARELQIAVADGPRGARFETQKRAEQSRFARSGRPDDGHDFPGTHGERRARRGAFPSRYTHLVHFEQGAIPPPRHVGRRKG